MHFTTTITTLGLVLSAAAVPASPSWIVDPAAATDAPAVPFTGTPVVVDSNVVAATTGDANVRNYCDFDVYLYVCGQDPAVCTPEYTLAAKTGTYSEEFSTPNNGRSIKMGTTAGEVSKPILQFEYTNDGTGLVYYDLSEVNGNPFGAYGFYLTSSSDKCFSANCPPPATNAVCPWVFTTTTNGEVKNCPVANSIGVSLCA